MISEKDFEIIYNPHKETGTVATTSTPATGGIPTAEDIKRAIPHKPAKDATLEQKQAYYKQLEAVGRTILKGFFTEKHHDNLTARRPFSGLQTTEYYKDAKTAKDNLYKDKDLKKRSAEIGHAVQLASQENWLGKASIPNLEKLTWEERFALIRWKNEDLKKEVLKQYLSLPDEKRTAKHLKAAMTRKGTKKATKAESGKEKTPKAKAQPVVVKVKPVIGKKEIEALIKQAEAVEKELTKVKSEFDKAMDKVKQAHGKLKEELVFAKRLMERSD